MRGVKGSGKARAASTSGLRPWQISLFHATQLPDQPISVTTEQTKSIKLIDLSQEQSATSWFTAPT